MRARLSVVAVAAATAAVAVGVGMAGASAKVAPDLSCNGTFSAQTYNKVDVPVGADCSLSDVTINTDLTVEGRLSGGSTLTIGGDVTAKGAQVIEIDSSDITGDVTITKMKGAPSDVDALVFEVNTVGGSFSWSKTGNGGTGDFEIATNTIAGDLTIKSIQVPGRGDANIVDETVGGKMTVKKLQGGGNKEVDANHVTGLLQCSTNDSPFESSGNVAAKFKGKCKA